MGGGPATRVSLVIRCYNEAKHLPRLFAELKRQTFRDFETIVVDSGSTDGTLDIVRSEDVHLETVEKEEFSFGRSLNIGCRAASGETLVFISAHCYPDDEDWLVNLLGGFDDPRVAAVYGKQRGGPDSAFSERRVMQRWFPDESIGHQEHPFINNANCAIRRSLWEEFPYDETLPGLEDVAWAQEVVRAGWVLSYRADAGVVHVHDESPSQIRHRYMREAITFQQVFPTEHFNALDFLRLISRNVWADAAAARTDRRLARELPGIVTFRFAQFLGTYQGFHMRRPASSELKQRFFYPDQKS